jgi:hypothetical protein
MSLMSGVESKDSESGVPMYSDGIGRTDATGPQGPKPVDPLKRVDSPAGGKPDQAKSASTPLDQADISANAAEVARYREMAELHREAYGPEDRSAKLNEVKARIASGHYDKTEVMDELAGKMIDESISAPAGSTDLNTIQSRTESGFYDRPEVIDQTAANIVNNLLPGLEE